MRRDPGLLIIPERGCVCTPLFSLSLILLSASWEKEEEDKEQERARKDIIGYFSFFHRSVFPRFDPQVFFLFARERQEKWIVSINYSQEVVSGEREREKELFGATVGSVSTTPPRFGHVRVITILFNPFTDCLYSSTIHPRAPPSLLPRAVRWSYH